MKKRNVLLIAIALCLLLGGFALRLDSGKLGVSIPDKALAQSAAQSDQPIIAHYRVSLGTATGGDYRLSGLEWQVRGSSSGGAYRLQGPASPSSGTPCCCNYLPCVRK